MTSSLVGSEMCIRDSFKLTAGPVPEQGFHDPINNFEPPPQGPEQGIGPVSYTHLTLPTICSV
eukprot:78077-Prorocentrum_lima.AAC.1